MNVEIGTKAEQFLFRKYIKRNFWNFFAVQESQTNRYLGRPQTLLRWHSAEKNEQKYLFRATANVVVVTVSGEKWAEVLAYTLKSRWLGAYKTKLKSLSNEKSHKRKKLSRQLVNGARKER